MQTSPCNEDPITPHFYIEDWGLQGYLVSDIHFMFVHYTFSSVWVAEWPPFGK